MFNHGYRPRGGQQHLTVFQFLREALVDKGANEVSLFDTMCRKRHRAIYEKAGLVGKNEIEGVLDFDRKFVAKIGKLVEEELLSNQ
ncbi:MAG: hypothetical protein A2Z14_11185 [Chloroflexi bacterium RBG_16_48_8]|nr:MAG: hypothetical protein A2Z14_11185 [Chloroflexi bacterium RBG_16_48_8]